MRWNLMQQHEPGNFRKGTLARWGVDEREATAELRIADFCFALPPEQLFSGGVTRRLARVALADRLPPSVLNGRRGYQYPGWYEGIDRAALERLLSKLEGHRAASSLLDLSGLQALASAWPSSGWESLDVIVTYRLAFLRAVSAGAFANHVRQ